ncbi:MAG: hypothetical protein JSW00_13985 [Thermoplasmata archaeon]|nr:MAG: hypothetical protein JSW00_13985 [Thermoplasmata archaeon]
MLEIIDTSDANEISAFLTTTFISHSYEVESTQSIVKLWDNIRKTVKLKDELDYISAGLAVGRIMDYRFEIEDIDIINSVINDIHTNIKIRKIESEDLQRELIFALLTSASISRSEKVETLRDIVDLWMEVKEGIEIKDEQDLIAAILTTGRIMELKVRAGGLEFINDIFMNMKKELEQKASDMAITKKEIAAAFIASAYVEISKKVEKIRDIVDSWLSICSQISVEDQWDYITIILSTGKIRDMDAMHIMDAESLKNTHDKIRTQIKNVAVE